MNIPEFKDNEYLTRGFKILDLLFSGLEIKDQAVKIVEEMFLRPYIPSKELCEKFQIDKDDLKKVYSLIRTSREVKNLFESSPYQYLTVLLGQLLREGKRTSRILNFEKPYPLAETMELFISSKCNARCKFCYRGGKSYRKKATFSTQQYVNVINEFADMGGQVIDISGGLEPLLSPSFTGILDAGLERGLIVNLYTNGIALDDPILIERVLKINKVRVSLNAHDKKSYKETMGVDKFDLVVKNLSNLVWAKKKRKANVKIGIGFVAFKENYRNMPAAVKLAQRLGVDSIDLRSVEVTDMGDFEEKQRNELYSILEHIRQKKLSGGYAKLAVSLADTFNPVLDNGSDYLKYVNEDLINALRYYRATLTPHGEIYALNLIGQPSRQNKRYLLGTIGKNGSLSDILNSEKKIPFEAKFLLAHDISLIIALSKLQSDIEFGISLEENPFNWK